MIKFFPILILFIFSLNAADKPNIILIMADDMGYGELGCTGHPTFKTPVLDKLAREGLRLTDFHSNGAVCSPTRAALMTGRYQNRSGIEGVVTAAKHRHTGLPLKETTMAEALKGAGYKTAMFGKWHLGYESKFNPVNQGFDKFHGFVSGNIDLFSHIDQEDSERTTDRQLKPGTLRSAGTDANSERTIDRQLKPGTLRPAGIDTKAPNGPRTRLLESGMGCSKWLWLYYIPNEIHEWGGQRPLSSYDEMLIKPRFEPIGQ